MRDAEYYRVWRWNRKRKATVRAERQRARDAEIRENGPQLVLSCELIEGYTTYYGVFGRRATQSRKAC